jgi:hypothetical protein
MKYHYKCVDFECGGVTERIQPIQSHLPDQMTCGFCPSRATLVVTAPGVMRSTMSNQPIDITVGHMANARREQLAERQTTRDKVRAASGQVGLTATSHDTFRPITKKEQALRETIHHRVQQAGGAPQDLSPGDRKLVGS